MVDTIGIVAAVAAGAILLIGFGWLLCFVGGLQRLDRRAADTSLALARKLAAELCALKIAQRDPIAARQVAMGLAEELALPEPDGNRITDQFDAARSMSEDPGDTSVTAFTGPPPGAITDAEEIIRRLSSATPGPDAAEPEAGAQT